MAETPVLQGRTVGITADRRAEDQAVMFRRLGAEVIVGAAIRSVPTADTDELKATVASLIAAPADFVVANTGYGMRTLFALADGWGIGDDLRGALAQADIVARGPKAAGAMRSAGLTVGWRSPSEQLGEVGDHLSAAGLAGRRVALQLHGDDSPAFVASLEAEGATVIPLPVYRWTRPGDDEPALALIDACCRRQVDALTFTSAPGVRNFVAVAEDAGRADDLVAAATPSATGTAGMVVGCVGPVCAAAATEEGFAAPVVPEAWRLGSMVKVVADALAPRR